MESLVRYHTFTVCQKPFIPIVIGFVSRRLAFCSDGNNKLKCFTSSNEVSTAPLGGLHPNIDDEVEVLDFIQLNKCILHRHCTNFS